MPTEPLPAAAQDQDDISDGPPRAVLIAALVIAVVAIGAILVIAATRSTPTQPVAIASVPAPQADSPTATPSLRPCPENSAVRTGRRPWSPSRPGPRPGGPTPTAMR